jgi:hypothetical protein
MTTENVAHPPGIPGKLARAEQDHEQNGRARQKTLQWARLVELDHQAADVVAVKALARAGDLVVTDSLCALCRRWRDKAATLRRKADDLGSRALFNSARNVRVAAVVIEQVERELVRALAALPDEACPKTTRTGQVPA